MRTLFRNKLSDSLTMVQTISYFYGEFDPGSE